MKVYLMFILFFLAPLYCHADSPEGEWSTYFSGKKIHYYHTMNFDRKGLSMEVFSVCLRPLCRISHVDFRLIIFRGESGGRVLGESKILQKQIPLIDLLMMRSFIKTKSHYIKGGKLNKGRFIVRLPFSRIEYRRTLYFKQEGVISHGISLLQ